MRKIFLTVFLVLVLIVAGCARGNTESAQQSSKNVIIRGHAVSGDLVISKGTTVVFTNKDSFEGFNYDRHTVTSGTIDPSGNSGAEGVVPGSGSGIADGLFGSGLKLDQSFSYTFGKEGVYTYYIAEHPTYGGLGRIIVK